jgi:hypothetical protein
MIATSLPAQAQQEHCTELGIALQDAGFLSGADRAQIIDDLLTKVIQQDCVQDEAVLSYLCPLLPDLTADIKDLALINALTVACEQGALGHSYLPIYHGLSF